MAEEEKQQEEQQEEPEVKQKKGLPVKLIIIAVLGVFFIGAIVVVIQQGVLPNLMGKDTLQSLDTSDEKTEMGPIYPLDTFIVNLLGGKGKNYLKAKVELEMDSAKLKEEVDKRLPQIRDGILTLLSSKTHDDIKSLEGKFQLRAEIISMLNQYLKTGKIVNIYFTDLIVQ